MSSELRWMNFSGAPALLLPRSSVSAWHGIFSSVPPRRDSKPDLHSDNGDAFYLHDTFDFAYPKTAYDRLCGEFQDRRAETLIVPIGEVDAFSVSDGSDTFSWWSDESMIVSGAERLPDRDALRSLDWRRIHAIEVREPEWLLANAALNGIEMKDGSPDLHAVSLELGIYVIESAHTADQGLYRLSRSPT